MSTNKHRFHYEPFEEALETYVSALGKDPKRYAPLTKLKFMVLGTAWVDFQIWHPDTDQEEAMSWAWEDMIMAFQGFGESTLTGVIQTFWDSAPQNLWEQGRLMLNKAKGVCESSTPKTVRRRYYLTWRAQTVRTPEWGFELPAILPTWGPRLREWAKNHGLDPTTAEAQMMKIEEAERMGLIDLGTDLQYYVGGPVDEEVSEERNAKTPSLPVEADPAILYSGGRRPVLRLVENNE